MKRTTSNTQRTAGFRWFGSRETWPALLLSAFVAGALPASLMAADADRDPLTDRGMTRAIETDLLIDPGVSAHLIDVETTSGIVTLSGSVDNVLAQERAVQIASSIRGVESVIDQIKVEPEPRSDAAIRGDIQQALLRDPATDSYEVTVTVDDGIATLKGQVESWQEKQLSARVAKGVRGVTGVDNQITWNWTTDRIDSEIRNDIEQRLAWDLWVNDGLINVAVNDGRVTLSGSVGSAMEKYRAVSDAWVAGVQSVDEEKLQVDPWLRDDDRRKSRTPQDRSDADIHQAVSRAFLYDPRVYSFNPTVEVNDGVVTLSGTVEDLQARQAALSDARNTVGVRRVVNLLKVRPPGSPTDHQIETDIREALEDSPYVDRFAVTVQVVNQKAYLSGTADTLFEKNQAGRLAAGVRGVADVQNNLTLSLYSDTYPRGFPYWSYSYYYRPPHLQYGDSDWEIRESIESQLYWSPFVDDEQITVMVEDGVATLSGNVDNRMERGAAMDNAYQGGAVSVNNQLAVNGESY